MPTCWPSSTVAILGGGPSLTREDVEACRDRVRVIAINTAYQLAPWADVLYACDAKWWRWHQGVPGFTGRKYALRGCDMQFPQDAGIQVLKNTGRQGLESDPTGLRNGQNSGYQAINLAVHLGAVRILLLGYDMGYTVKGPSHWHGEHPDCAKPPVQDFLPHFATLIEPLRRLGISVINCSRQTALTCFPRQSLADALTQTSEAVA